MLGLRGISSCDGQTSPGQRKAAAPAPGTAWLPPQGLQLPWQGSSRPFVSPFAPADSLGLAGAALPASDIICRQCSRCAPAGLGSSVCMSDGDSMPAQGSACKVQQAPGSIGRQHACSKICMQHLTPQGGSETACLLRNLHAMCKLPRGGSEIASCSSICMQGATILLGGSETICLLKDLHAMCKDPCSAHETACLLKNLHAMCNSPSG